MADGRTAASLRPGYDGDTGKLRLKGSFTEEKGKLELDEEYFEDGSRKLKGK